MEELDGGIGEFEGLEEEEGCHHGEGSYAQFAQGDEDQSGHGEGEQDIPSRKEDGVQAGEEGQDQKPPGETAAEVFSLAELVAILDGIGEFEEKGEDGVRFPGEQKEEGVFHVLVDGGHERSGDGVGVVDEMLQKVDEHDGDDGKAPESIDDM